MRLIRPWVVGVLAVAFAAFVWPTPYEIWHGGPGRSIHYRRNRFTGDIQRLEDGAGWRSVVISTPTPPAELREFPPHALARVVASGTWIGNEIRFHVRNESGWRLRE